MIRLIDGIGIEAGANCYNVGYIRNITNKKTGVTTEMLQDIGYYSTLESALMGARIRMRLDALKEYDGDLKGAMEAIRASDERIFDAFDKSGIAEDDDERDHFRAGTKKEDRDVDQR